MISFTSLFLGLVLGAQTVELAVGEEVAVVELFVDGRLAGVVDAPPWSLECDFGAELAPHRLDAVGFDGLEREVARATQWVNLPRPPAETTIVLEGGGEEGERRARLSWESLGGGEPTAVRVSFDGRPLRVDDPRSIPLPSHDPGQLHFLRAEVEFGARLSSTAELVFGGGYADRISSELTAIPVRLAGRRKTLSPRELEGGLAGPDGPLRIAAIERGAAEVVLVRDGSAWDELRRIRNLALNDDFTRVRWFGTGRDWTDPRAGWRDWVVQFLWPVARRESGSRHEYDLFPPSSRYQLVERTLQGWLTTVEPPRGLAGPQRLADAVAVAGLSAAAGNRRRAVVLVLGDAPEDSGKLPAALVRRYLERLHVPLHVWSVTAAPGPAAAAWGDAVDISTSRRLERAVATLGSELERQRMVWIDGIHLPQEIAVAAGRREIEPVGGEPEGG